MVQARGGPALRRAAADPPVVSGRSAGAGLGVRVLLVHVVLVDVVVGRDEVAADHDAEEQRRRQPRGIPGAVNLDGERNETRVGRGQVVLHLDDVGAHHEAAVRTLHRHAARPVAQLQSPHRPIVVVFYRAVRAAPALSRYRPR